MRSRAEAWFLHVEHRLCCFDAELRSEVAYPDLTGVIDTVISIPGDAGRRRRKDVVDVC
ncbi:MAG: hypothetical protein JRF33_05735 [Deltaproteobacteria bacterium]|nr:hypothetical protein [Deltaproteobacteria bacterium]